MTSSLNMVTISVHWSVLLILLQDGWTPLHAACQEGHDEVAELLLQAGASVDQETEVRCGDGQDWVCDTEWCTHTVSFLPFVSSTLSQFEGLTLYTMTVLNANIAGHENARNWEICILLSCHVLNICHKGLSILISCLWSCKWWKMTSVTKMVSQTQLL